MNIVQYNKYYKVIENDIIVIRYVDKLYPEVEKYFLNFMKNSIESGEEIDIETK